MPDSFHAGAGTGEVGKAHRLQARTGFVPMSSDLPRPARLDLPCQSSVPWRSAGKRSKLSTSGMHMGKMMGRKIFTSYTEEV